MSYQEKRSLASLIATMLGYGLYFWFVFQRYGRQSFEPQEELQFWAWVVVFMIIVQVAFIVVVQILFGIYSTLTKDTDPGLVDERDKLVELKATRNGFIAFMAGFMGAMTAAIFELSISKMFSFILLGFLLSGIVLYFSEFLYYRRGF